MFANIVVGLEFMPSRFQALFIGVLSVFAIFIIVKLIILVKNLIFNWL